MGSQACELALQTTLSTETSFVYKSPFLMGLFVFQSIRNIDNT